MTSGSQSEGCRRQGLSQASREALLPFSRTCNHCQAQFRTAQRTAIYCTRKCKTDAANLEAARGKQLYRLAYGWRKGKGAKFSDLSWLVDQFIKEDREAGRQPPPFGPTDMSVSQSYFTRGGGSRG